MKWRKKQEKAEWKKSGIKLKDKEIDEKDADQLSHHFLLRSSVPLSDGCSDVSIIDVTTRNTLVMGSLSSRSSSRKPSTASTVSLPSLPRPPIEIKLENGCILVKNSQEYRLKYSSVRSHRSLVRLLRPARFACALSFAHSRAHGTVSH